MYGVFVGACDRLWACGRHPVGVSSQSGVWLKFHIYVRQVMWAWLIGLVWCSLCRREIPGAPVTGRSRWRASWDDVWGPPGW